jgi:quercetin dioxygenase-like cupin family protein
MTAMAKKSSPDEGRVSDDNSAKTELKDTVRPPEPQPGLKYLSWNEVERENLSPLLDRQLIVGHEVMLARILMKKGCIVPLHSHQNEQLSYSRNQE